MQLGFNPINQYTPKRSNIAFRSHYVVKISKRAFVDTDNLPEVLNTFKAIVSRACGDDKKNSPLRAIFGLANKKPKTFTFLESLNYTEIYKQAKKACGGLYWAEHNFKKNLGHQDLKFQKSQSPDFHTFVILTKEVKDNVLKEISSRKILPIFNKAKKSTPESIKRAGLADLYVAVKFNDVITNRINNIRSEVPPKGIKADTLDGVEVFLKMFIEK